jgi:hypothetical protein
MPPFPISCINRFKYQTKRSSLLKARKQKIILVKLKKPSAVSRNADKMQAKLSTFRYRITPRGGQLLGTWIFTTGEKPFVIHATSTKHFCMQAYTRATQTL